MKLNWGHYIAISFSLFVLLVLYMVYRSYQNNHDLVAEDYYNQEIKFQEVIDKKKNAASLEENISWESINGGIMVNFPRIEEPIRGKILLFRPSDMALDVKFDVIVDGDNRQFLFDPLLAPGKYLIQIDWMAGSEAYYTEGSAYIIE
jgi:hypothetical protein